MPNSFAYPLTETATDVNTDALLSVDPSKDEIVSAIEKCVAACTFLPEENAESMQVLRYEIGQKYDAHFDYFRDKNNVKYGGQRFATVLMYLTHVKKGGETVFPNAEGSHLQYKDETWSGCSWSGLAASPGPVISNNRVNLGHSMSTLNNYNDGEEEFASLEPFFFDEAEAVCDHERRMRILQEEERRKEQRNRDLKVHNAAMKRIREYEPKRRSTYFTRIYFVNLSKFNLDEESPLDPMRDTNVSIDMHGTVCKEVGELFIGDESTDIEKCFIPCISANVLSVKIASSDVGFPIDVYGTVIARDDLDLKCVYLFQCDRDHSQLIVPKDTSLILTGPKRGLALIDGIYFEVDLKIKCGQGHKDKQFSKGLIILDGRKSRSEDEFGVERVSLDTKHSKVVLTYAVVKRAIEATIAIEVLQGRFFGSITACTTSVRNSVILHDTKLVKVKSGNGKGAIKLLRRVVVVCLKEKLILTVAARNGDKRTIKFTPRVNGGDENEFTCGSIKMRVKVTWSIIHRSYLPGFL